MQEFNKTFDPKTNENTLNADLHLSPKREVKDIIKTFESDKAEYQNILSGADELLLKANQFESKKVRIVQTPSKHVT